MDVVRLQDLANNPLQLLGLIDIATLNHIVAFLPDRRPSTMLDAATTFLLTPFGNMSTIITDQGGSFMGDFLDSMNALHIEVQYIPADAHYQVGVLGHHNHMWRTMVERVTDATATTTREQVRIAMTSVSHAKNSLNRRNVRSPAMAVFG